MRGDHEAGGRVGPPFRDDVLGRPAKEQPADQIEARVEVEVHRRRGQQDEREADDRSSTASRLPAKPSADGPRQTRPICGWTWIGSIVATRRPAPKALAHAIGGAPLASCLPAAPRTSTARERSPCARRRPRAADYRPAGEGTASDVASGGGGFGSNANKPPPGGPASPTARCGGWDSNPHVEGQRLWRTHVNRSATAACDILAIQDGIASLARMCGRYTLTNPDPGCGRGSTSSSRSRSMTSRATTSRGPGARRPPVRRRSRPRPAALGAGSRRLGGEEGPTPADQRPGRNPATQSAFAESFRERRCRYPRTASTNG